MSETTILTVSTADASASYNYVDAVAREGITAARAELDALKVKADAWIAAGGGSGDDNPPTPPEPPKPTPDQAVTAIDAAWNTDQIWATLAQYGDTVRENPSMFSKYIGQTLTYTHATYGQQQVRCVDVAHYDRSDGKGRAAFMFDHVALPTTHNMNSSNTNSGGYPASAMNTFLEGDFANGMPDAIKSAIVPVTIPCSLTAGSSVAPTDTPNCTLFLLSEKEVFGTSDYDNEGTQIAWYSANNNNSSRVKLYNGSSGNWWLRSPYSSTYFATVNNGGGLGGNGAGYARGVCPGFNIG